MMRYFKPDPLIVLVIVVGLGALITSSVQAQGHYLATSLHVRGAQLVMQPVKTVMHGIKLEWAEEAIHHPAMGAFFSDEGLQLNEQNRSQDAALSLAWQPLPQSDLLDEVVPDEFTAQAQPGVYFRLQHRW